MTRFTILFLALSLALASQAQTPIKDILAKIDPATGQAGDTATEFTISGVVAARTVLPNDQVLAFVLAAGEPALAVVTDLKESALLSPRNEVKLSGKLGAGPFGAALALKPGSVSLLGTNKAFGLSEPRGPEFFKDASSLQGRYVQLTNVTLAGPKAEAGGVIKARGAAGEVSVLVSKAVVGREVPAGPVNVFGIAVRQGAEWRLVGARFLQTDIKAMQLLATKHTCFTCHNADVKMVGPAYREVAAKYRNDPEAPARLIAQMENGGAGKWGPVAMMPFKGKIPPAEMRQLADWILGYRWDAILAE